VENSSSPVSKRVALVQKGISLWNKRDWEAALEDLHPQIEWRTSGVVPGIDQVYTGHEGAMRFWTTWTELWDEIRIDIEQMTERDDDVLVLARFQARGRDGVEVDQPVAFEFTSNDVGLLTRFKSYWNRDDLPVDVRTTNRASG
jgi:ketosteroid isomerase-like protein